MTANFSQLNEYSNKEEVDKLRRSNDDLRKKVEHLERYSRDFNVHNLGVSEEDGEDCTIILDYIGLEKGKGLKLRTPTVQRKNRVRGLDISLPSFIAGHLN